MIGYPRPDFFIVGSFKCGTTALYEYLRQHPAVFMPFHKEPLYFGDDLTRRYGRMSEEQYLALFREAEAGQRIGEASSWYLYSTSAAREIADFAPGARIIVMLRNPVDVMYAEHSQLIFNVEEDISDFGEALAAEPARRRGERMPPGPLRPETLYYRHSVRFAEQLQRYHEVFGPDRVHVIVYEDFRDRTAATYRAVLEFLDVDPNFAPAFSVRNPNKRVRFAGLQRLIYQPPGPLIHVVPWLRRFPIVHRLRGAALRLNSSATRRPPMDPGLRQRLLDEMAPEVRELGTLIGRDLSPWLEAPVPRAA
ncbi:MAG TPA: sulfotransferase [Candidatus Limnocylindria bacterium]